MRRVVVLLVILGLGRKLIWCLMRGSVSNNLGDKLSFIVIRYRRKVSLVEKEVYLV